MKRRTLVVSVIPDQPSVNYQLKSLLHQINDEWLVGRRYYSLITNPMLIVLDQWLVEDTGPLLMAPNH